MPLPETTTDSEPSFADADDLRTFRKERLVRAYNLFGALRWGAMGEGHISARDPIHSDHYWLSRYGVPFGKVTFDDLVLVTPDGTTSDGRANAINPAAHFIHWPVHEARPDIVCAAHTHTPWGTSFSALARGIEPISQESCAFVDDHALFDDEEVDIVSLDGGKRIAAAIGHRKAVSLRNHGHLTVGASVDEAVGWYVMFERVAEVHVKTVGHARPISLLGARRAKEFVGTPEAARISFEWLVATYLDGAECAVGSAVVV